MLFLFRNAAKTDEPMVCNSSVVVREGLSVSQAFE